MPPIKRLPKKLRQIILIIFLILMLTAGTGYVYLLNSPAGLSLFAEKNAREAFVGEIYDKIKSNYWNNLSDEQLLNLFKLSIEKNGGQKKIAKFDNPKKLLKTITDLTKNMNDDQKNKFLASVVQSVLASLPPIGRSGLYTQQMETSLNNTVANINPQKDLYKDLGLSKGASSEAVAKAYLDQSKQLEKQNTPQSQQKIKELSYAKDVLTQKDQKQRYDSHGIEPTIFSKIIQPDVLYVQFTKFSPTSLDEFQKTFNSYQDNNQLASLILDLRGNIGGAIDETANFLGFFLGKNQPAFAFYHQGKNLPFYTPTDRLASLNKFKQVIVLADQNTQSSAEIWIASIKKFHLGVVVGTTTRGWGSVEKVFPLDNQISTKEKYSLFLVHSLTMGDQNQPIEGRGVEPNINIKSPSWQQQLSDLLKNPDLTFAVARLQKQD